MAREFLSQREHPDGPLNRLYLSDWEHITTTAIDGVMSLYYTNKSNRGFMEFRDAVCKCSNDYEKEMETLLEDMHKEGGNVDREMYKQFSILYEIEKSVDWLDGESVDEFYDYVLGVKAIFESRQERLQKGVRRYPAGLSDAHP